MTGPTAVRAPGSRSSSANAADKANSSPDIAEKAEGRLLCNQNTPWRGIISGYRLPLALRLRMHRIGLGESLAYFGLQRRRGHLWRRWGSHLRHQGSRRRSWRNCGTRGIEDHAFGQFSVGMNPYDRTIGRVGGTDRLVHRIGRQAGICDQQKRKQGAADINKITHQRHLVVLHPARQHGFMAQPAITLFVPDRRKRFGETTPFCTVLKGDCKAALG